MNIKDRPLIFRWLYPAVSYVHALDIVLGEDDRITCREDVIANVSYFPLVGDWKLAESDRPLAPSSGSMFVESGVRTLFMNTIFYCVRNFEFWTDAKYSWNQCAIKTDYILTLDSLGINLHYDFRLLKQPTPEECGSVISGLVARSVSAPYKIKRCGQSRRDHRDLWSKLYSFSDRGPLSSAYIKSVADLKWSLSGVRPKTPAMKKEEIKRCLIRRARRVGLSRSEQRFFSMMFGASKLVQWIKNKADYEPTHKLQVAG